MRNAPPDFDHLDERRIQEEGITRCVQYFKCSDCDQTVDFPKQTKRRKPPAQLAKMASRQGWRIDLKKGQHKCPEHAQPSPRHEDPMTQTKQRPSETPPRHMTREDKRTIFREIDDCYDATSNAYVLDTTDQSIADKLKVPRAWVAEVREDSFGPAGPSPEVLQLAKDIKATADKLAATETAILEATDTLDKLNAEMTALLDRAETVVPSR